MNNLAVKIWLSVLLLASGANAGVLVYRSLQAVEEEVDYKADLYRRSKLANVLFTYGLPRRLADTTITVNALHPGLIATDIFRRNYGILGPLIQWIISHRSITPEEGADNTVFLSTSTDVEGVSGRYFVKRNAVKSAALSYYEALAKRLWEVSERLTAIP